jgi:peptidyl-dipeptidase A
MRRPLLLAALASATLTAVACGGGTPQPQSAAPPTASVFAVPASTAPDASPPSVDDARAFLTDVDKNLRRVFVAKGHAEWVYETYINHDSDILTTEAEEVMQEYFTHAITASKRFDGLTLPPDLARQMHLLKISPTIPAPSDAGKRKELAEIESWMTGAYGSGTYCPPRSKGKCLHLDELSKTLAKSRKYDELLEAWTGWHAIATPMRPKFAQYVALGNEGAKEIGFGDVGELWRAGYDMSPADFYADVDRLWAEVKPLYDELHCYVRGQLQKTYGKDKVPDHAPIPAHLLGNMWAQDWGNLLDMVVPYKGEPTLDVSKKLESKKIEPKAMVKMGESFFTSLGFDPLPKTFWERSQFSRPQDREVICHASAWDVTYDGDLRVKMCLEPTEEDLVTIHHELGHDFYFQSYDKLPILFQQGANAGFHEAIGDTIALSVTPDYLKTIGLLDATPKGDHGRINNLMKTALDKIAFLPFGLLIDKWRWDVFSGKTTPDHYNSSWWDLRQKYQGVAPPSPRDETTFDPGAKFHVAASSPYVIYFLARIYQFQFHRALCKAAGFTGPLDQCSIFGNKAAGEKLRAMLALGASKSWQEAMAAVGEPPKGDATAMLQYYAPLNAWLDEQTKGMSCGW